MPLDCKLVNSKLGMQCISRIKVISAGSCSALADLLKASNLFIPSLINNSDMRSILFIHSTSRDGEIHIQGK